MIWQPITELETNQKHPANQTLTHLADAWQTHRQGLPETVIKTVNDRVNREWSIETGILELLYKLDRDVTALLIEHGITKSSIPSWATDQPPEMVYDVLRDQKEAVDWLLDFSTSERPFSESFIKELHALITRSQPTAAGMDHLGRRTEIPLRRGAYKLYPNNPTIADGTVHEYCPPEQVTVEMERLISLYEQYRTEKVAPEVLAAWMHHRFVQIHPFQDGNGRVGRSLASLVFIQSGMFPLVIHRDQRDDYLATCMSADRGDLEPMVDIFASTQRKTLIGAIGFVSHM